MASRADFTEQEWEQLQKGVAGVGLLVSLSDRGFFDSFKEAGALAKHLGEARTRSRSEVVRELAELRGTGFGLRVGPEEVESETLEALGSAVATLEAKSPADLDAYRELVLDVAESVAGAAKGGDAAEGEAIGKIRTALGSPAA